MRVLPVAPDPRLVAVLLPVLAGFAALAIGLLVRSVVDHFFEEGLMPGTVIGRLPLWGRLGLTVGSGVQVAATHTRSANHNVIFTARLPF
jgi:hypothetical protein